MNDYTNEYMLYLIKQYYEKPKANAEVKALLDSWGEFKDFIINDFISQIDIDTAGTHGLDLIGKIVNLSRQVNEVVPVSFFGFSNNPQSKGFWSISNPDRVSAPFFRVNQKTFSPYQLQNEEYRKFLKIKIAKNTCSPYLAADEKTSLQQVVFDAFNGGAYVSDNKDGSLTLYVSPSVDTQTLRLILNLDILPRPITFNYRIIIQAEPGETFGFSNNKNAKGFASISDPTRQGGVFARIYNG